MIPARIPAGAVVEFFEAQRAKIIEEALGEPNNFSKKELRRRRANVAIQFNRKLASARECNLLEDPGSSQSIENNTFRFDLRGFEIKTFELRFP